MGGLRTIENLVANARSAGLRLDFDGELLRIKGNRNATAIAKELLDRKTEVMKFLSEEIAPAAVADVNIEMHNLAIVVETVGVGHCPICGTVLEWQRGKHYLHVWCPSPGHHFDAWRADDGRKLKETDAPADSGDCERSFRLIVNAQEAWRRWGESFTSSVHDPSTSDGSFGAIRP